MSIDQRAAAALQSFGCSLQVNKVSAATPLLSFMYHYHDGDDHDNDHDDDDNDDDDDGNDGDDGDVDGRIDMLMVITIRSLSSF